MKLRPWIYLSLFIAVLVVFTVINLRRRLTITHGTPNNVTRVKLHIPVIEQDMHQTYWIDSFFASHWWAPKEYPTDKKPIHYLKTIVLTRSPARVIERDSYRMISDSGYYQFHIKSIVTNNDYVSRYGSLVLPSKTKKITRTLGETGIDSVAKAWAINYLVAGK